MRRFDPFDRLAISAKLRCVNYFLYPETGCLSGSAGDGLLGSKAMLFGYQYQLKSASVNPAPSCRVIATSRLLRVASLVALAMLSPIFAGCSGEAPEYRANTLYAASITHESGDSSPERLAEQAKSLVDQLFGSVDSPQWPADLPPVVDMDHVTRSAGPVGRAHDKIERGLYRKHCAQCHGISGDGLGPAAALLAPYPRDFRRGTFKFKTSEAGAKPLHQDIVKTITVGIPGSSMPGFGTLNASEEFANDIESLSHYVRFLAIRGEIERRVIRSWHENEDGFAEPDKAKSSVRTISDTVVQSWKQSENRALKVPESTVPNDAESIARGKLLFSSELTACVKCHANDGTGKGTVPDYDEWTKDWTIRAGIDPTQKSEWRPMKKFGALKPVPAHARNLTLGAFRGGSTPNDLFARLAGGIEGSPMPAIARASNGNPGLSDNDVWDLIHYVQSLGPAKSPGKTENTTTAKSPDNSGPSKPASAIESNTTPVSADLSSPTSGNTTEVTS